MNKIIKITKQECELIKAFDRNAPITRLMKHDSKRHHYWMAEEEALLKRLAEIRRGE